ncbi:MAG: hypothetical protein F6K56_29965 [Moorea sp. SIO3G5]|nr:hypothetical protein [Moorena sp. SIO3G5]
MIRANLHAAGGKKGVKKTNYGRRNRGGFSYLNTHTLVLVVGFPLTFQLSPGHTNESIFFEQLMELRAVKGSGKGRPRIRPL